VNWKSKLNAWLANRRVVEPTDTERVRLRDGLGAGGGSGRGCLGSPVSAAHARTVGRPATNQ